MRPGRWGKAMLLLLPLHLPLIAALHFTRQSPSRTAATDRAASIPLATRVAVPPFPATAAVGPATVAPLAPVPPLLPVALPPALPSPREAEAPLAAPGANVGLLSPRQQEAAAKEFIEGHWLGLEVIPLTPALAKEYRIPEGEEGILVDEITLEAAESGLLAGDLVHRIDGILTPDLRQFFVATQQVKQRAAASVEVRRQGQTLSFTMRARNAPELGFAQMEAAQPIVPGSISPHRTHQRACTECHVIMASGGQLPTDSGDILPTPGTIRRDAVAPHRYRGSCDSCHRVLP